MDGTAAEETSWPPSRGGMQLGHGGADDEQLELTPRLVQGLVGHRATAVSAGNAFTAVVTDAGEVFTFGHALEGQLGHGISENVSVPRLVQGMAGMQVVAMSAGDSHTVVCTAAGGFGWMTTQILCNRDFQYNTTTKCSQCITSNNTTTSIKVCF